MRESIIVIPAKKSAKNSYLLGDTNLTIKAVALCSTLGMPLYFSTDDLWLNSGATLHKRPKELADTPNVLDPIVHLVEEFKLDNPIITLVQVTSPFTRKQDILSCWGMLQSEKYACVQTITPCPHNSHSFNHRSSNGAFLKLAERLDHPNRQTKPKEWLFGNVVSFSFNEAVDQGTVFPEPSFGIEIENLFAFDVDNYADVEMARALLPLFEEKTK